MNAVLTVSAADTPLGPERGEANLSTDRSEVIIIDTSGSMTGSKLHEAKVATAAAIGGLPDGIRFGIVAGDTTATVVYPPAPPLAVASAATRFEATEALRTLEAKGGTAIGAWLSLTTQMLRDGPGIKHAILLTDGKNEHEAPDVLGRVLTEAQGVFQCDCRGVGFDWSVAELRTVATALLGTYDIVADPSELSADFATMMGDSLSKQVAEVALRVWTPKGADILDLTQLQEEEAPLPLTGTRVEDRRPDIGVPDRVVGGREPRLLPRCPGAGGRAR